MISITYNYLVHITRLDHLSYKLRITLYIIIIIYYI